jgi:hypothetical protein
VGVTLLAQIALIPCDPLIHPSPHRLLLSVLSLLPYLYVSLESVSQSVSPAVSVSSWLSSPAAVETFCDMDERGGYGRENAVNEEATAVAERITFAVLRSVASRFLLLCILRFSFQT